MRRTPKVSELKVDTIADALSTAQQWIRTRANDDLCWFRGVKDSNLSLLPGAYWRDGYREFDTLLQFSQEGRAFTEVGELDDWRTYYLAQHSGIPTRLLDWTENFVTALFFATDGWKGDSQPCVWIIRPCKINELSIGWSGLISPERNNELNAWMPTAIENGSKKIPTDDSKWIYDSAKPLALYPRKNNARMIAQQGTFTVHGTEKRSLDSWVIDEVPKGHEEVLCKIVFSKRLKSNKLSGDLSALGLRRSTIYPDLHNFVLQMKEQHGWA